MGGGGIGGTGSGLGGATGGSGTTGGSAGAPAVLCAANRPTCDGNRAATCNPEGTGYLVVGIQCSSTQTCLNGACENHKCTPSSVSCVGEALTTCAANGLSSTSKTCDVSAKCMSGAGSFACVCGINQYVQANACVSCGAGTTNAAGDNATGGNTSCDATLCGANQYVQANACVACGVGSTNTAGDDATGGNTRCDATLCGVNQYVQANACVS